MDEPAPENRLKATVDAATQHASKSLESYADWTKSMVDRLASPDGDQSKLTSDLSGIWAQMIKDSAYGWITAYRMAQDLGAVQPKQAKAADGGAEPAAEGAGPDPKPS